MIQFEIKHLIGAIIAIVAVLFFTQLDNTNKNDVNKKNTIIHYTNLNLFENDISNDFLEDIKKQQAILLKNDSFIIDLLKKHQKKIDRIESKSTKTANRIRKNCAQKEKTN